VLCRVAGTRGEPDDREHGDTRLGMGLDLDPARLEADECVSHRAREHSTTVPGRRSRMVTVFPERELQGVYGVVPRECTVNVLSDGTSSAPEVQYALDPAGYSVRTWSFSTTASSSGTIDVGYVYSGLHAWFAVTVTLQAWVNHGGVVSARDVVARQVFKAGDTTQVTWSAGGISLSLQARALGAAAVGQSFNVQNPVSKKVIEVVATAPGQAVTGPDAQRLKAAGSPQYAAR